MNPHPDPPAATARYVDAELRQQRLTHCGLCDVEFLDPVSEEQARADWGDAADDEIAYACGPCAEREGFRATA